MHEPQHRHCSQGRRRRMPCASRWRPESARSPAPGASEERSETIPWLTDLRIAVNPHSGWGALSFSPRCSLPVPSQGTRGVGMEVEAMASTAGTAGMVGTAGEVSGGTLGVWPYWRPSWWPYGYAYPYGYPSTYYNQTYVSQTPQVSIEPPSSPPVWYYCENPQGYYP